MQNTIEQILHKRFNSATEICVKDISGGCGAMFEVVIVSSEFSGMPKVKQHMAVTQVCVLFILQSFKFCSIIII